MRTLLAPVLVFSMMAGCGGDDGAPLVDGPPGAADARTDAGVDSLVVSGSVVPAAGSGPTMAFWSVFIGADYLYKFGEGLALAGTFMLEVPGTPPAMARVQMGEIDFGVGMVLVFPNGTSIPDGVVDQFPAFTGIAGRHGVVYRGPGDPGTIPAWLAAFPLGLSCGQCVDSTTGFDTFTPAACDAFAVGDTASDVCNWY